MVEVRPPSIIKDGQWKVHECGWNKVNFDAYLGLEFKLSLEFLIRDEARAVLATGTRCTRTNRGVEESIVMAVCFGQEMALVLGYEKVQLEGDACNVINYVILKKGCTPIHVLYNYLFALSSYFSYFSCIFIRSSGNTVAYLIGSWDTIPN